MDDVLGGGARITVLGEEGKFYAVVKVVDHNVDGVGGESVGGGHQQGVGANSGKVIRNDQQAYQQILCKSFKY